MSRIVFCFLFFILVFAGCRNKPAGTAKPGEGMITYRVSYPDSSNYGIKVKFFPKEIILVFKDDRASFIATGALGMVQLVNLLDHKNKKYTSLLIDNFRGNFGCMPTPDDIKTNEESPKFKFEYPDEKKMIAGVECKKAIATDLSTNKSSEIFYDPEIKFYYWNSPFKNFNPDGNTNDHANCLFMEYTHTVNNLTMKLVATKVDLHTPVDTNLFNVRGDYIWLNQKEFYARLSQL